MGWVVTGNHWARVARSICSVIFDVWLSGFCIRLLNGNVAPQFRCQVPNIAPLISQLQVIATLRGNVITRLFIYKSSNAIIFHKAIVISFYVHRFVTFYSCATLIAFDLPSNVYQLQHLWGPLSQCKLYGWLCHYSVKQKDK